MSNFEENFKFEENKSNLKISFERISFIFFVFFIIAVIFASKTIYLGLKKTKDDGKYFLMNFSGGKIESCNLFAYLILAETPV